MSSGESPRPKFDVTSVGEPLLRYTAPLGSGLATAPSLQLHVGGAESNVCSALAQLGRRCAFGSKLPRHALGQRVLRHLKSVGVDTTAVVLCDEGRVGSYYVEPALPPQSVHVLYDRRGSTFTELRGSELEHDHLLDTRVLHLTGITAALGAASFSLVHELMLEARRRGVRVSFDVNYRSKLWGRAEACDRLSACLGVADIVFCSEHDARYVFGLTGEGDTLPRALRTYTDAAEIIVSLGERGVAALHGDALYTRAAHRVQLLDRPGAGDALAAGVLDGLLDGSLERGLAQGVALAALALSQTGDAVTTSRADLEQHLLEAQPDIVR